MQITVELPPNVLREAELRGKPVAAFVQQLLELGIAALEAQARQERNGHDAALPESELLGANPCDSSVLQSAMERIRALKNSSSLNTPSLKTPRRSAPGFNPAHHG